jgi:hypothetical protein
VFLSVLLCGALQDNTHLASRLFAALSAEAPGSRTALQEALGAMAGALASGIQKGEEVDASKLAEIEELLMTSISNEQVCLKCLGCCGH